MFLHSGASLHGHEYSPRRTISAPGPPPKRRPLLKTTLCPSVNLAESGDVDYFTTTHKSDLAHQQRVSTDGTYRPSSLVLRQRAASNSLTSRKDTAVRFLQPGRETVLTPSASEDEESVAGSEYTDGSAELSTRRRRRKRMPRESIRYALAQPAPQLRTKQRRFVQIRPRVLLQLQEIGDKRAIPAFDLIPSHIVAGSLIIPGLAKRFPRIFHADAELSQNDVLLVHNEDFGSASSPMSSMSSDDDKRSDDSRDVLAVISGASGRSQTAAEVVLEDGQPWYAVPMLNGSYEFTRTGDDGQTTTARWVRRSTSTRHDAVLPGPSSPRSSLHNSVSDSKWTFSVIDPSSRRHPVLGTLTAETLEIYDSYTTLSTSSGRYPPSRPFSPERSGYCDQNYSQARHSQELRTTQKVPCVYKTLMIATASWIRLQQQGWPASANPNCARSASVGLCSLRRQTYPPYDGDSSRAASPLNSPASSDSTDDVTSCKRRSQQKGPVRAMSTGRAYMKRRNPRTENSTATYLQDLSKKKPHVEEKQCNEKDEISAGCMTKLRQWTHKLFHGKNGAHGVK